MSWPITARTGGSHKTNNSELLETVLVRSYYGYLFVVAKTMRSFEAVTLFVILGNMKTNHNNL